MKTKQFLGVQVLETKPNLYGLLGHYLKIILFTGIAYCLLAMIFGLFQGNAWEYFQSSTPNYLVQAILLALALPIGLVAYGKITMKAWVWKWDLVVLPLATLLAWLITNEIWNL